MSRVAVVLFNLGGPDRPEAVRPFLLNMFRDPAILPLPALVRFPLANVIAQRRAPVTREIYARIGGGSPLRENTEHQAAALTESLADVGEVRVFTAMRYWHPRSDETAAAVKSFGPDEVVLLPLYPQFSSTTTGSSLRDWERATRAMGLEPRGRAVCCYPAAAGWVRAVAEATKGGYEAAAGARRPRVLFSAHGLPRRVVAAGDPYQWQVERTVAAVVAALGIDDLDWVICYQSRVGPLEWIGPDIDAELVRAGADGVPVVVVPVAFVSEHSETLVELDIEYRRLAARAGVPCYVRVPTVGIRAPFIEELAGLVRRTLASDRLLYPATDGRLCPATCGRCPLGDTEH